MPKKSSNLPMLLMLVLFGVALGVFSGSFPEGWFFPGLVAVALLAPFVGGPILIHQTQWQSLDPVFKPFDPRGPESPPEVSMAFDDIEADLDRLGFSPVRSYQTHNVSNNALGFVILFSDPETGEVAKIVAAVGKGGPIRIGNALLVFGTEFSDGTEVVTSNNRGPRVYPGRLPPFHAFHLPQLRDTPSLLAAHRVLARRFESGRTRVDPVGDDPDGYLRSREFLIPQAHFVEVGYNYRDEVNEVLRPTWKGAILMTWKLAFPVKQIRQSLRRIKARSLLRELEAEGLTH